MYVTVSELKEMLETLERNGHGNKEVYYASLTRLGSGVENPRGIVSIEINSLFGEQIAYIKSQE